MQEMLPTLTANGTKLYLVSIGTPERGREFSKETGFDVTRLLVDPDNVTYDKLRLNRGLAKTFLDINTPLSIWSRLQKDNASTLRDIMRRWKPWIPPKGAEQAVLQGGVLVFEGRQCIMSSYDKSTGAHADFDLLTRVVQDSAAKSCGTQACEL